MGGNGDGAAALCGASRSAAGRFAAASDAPSRPLAVLAAFGGLTALTLRLVRSGLDVSGREPWPMPGLVRAEQVVGGLRSPRALGVAVDGGRGVEQRLEDPP